MNVYQSGSFPWYSFALDQCSSEETEKGEGTFHPGMLTSEELIGRLLALFVNPERVEEEKKGNDNTIGDDAN